MKALILALLLFFAVIPGLHAQENIRYYRIAGNSIYAEAAGIRASSMSVSLNYEWLATPNVGFRAGYVKAFALDNDQLKTGIEGPLAMLVCLIGDGPHKMEFGVGASFAFNMQQSDKLQIPPAGVLGYRYQRDEGGLLFRAGLSMINFVGTPVQLGIGYSF